MGLDTIKIRLNSRPGQADKITHKSQPIIYTHKNAYSEKGI